MENINLEITLNHSPFYDNLLVELQSVAEQKKKYYAALNHRKKLMINSLLQKDRF